MSSDKNPNIKRGKAILSKVLTIQNKIIAQKYRGSDGYPINGFTDINDYNLWISKNTKPTDDNFYNFLNEIVASEPNLSDTLNSYQFYLPLKDLYLYGKVSENSYWGLSSTGCEWFEISESDRQNKNLKIKIREGLYMKVSVDSTIKNIKDFLNNERERGVFRYLQKGIQSRKLITPKRVRKTQYDKFYLMIIKLRKKDTATLMKLSGGKKGLKKEDYISIIVSKKRYLISPDYVKNIFSTRKNKVEKL